MKITHIYHSGFLVETQECYYLFDYYKGSLSLPDKEKPVFVFASHSHQDHYCPSVFPLLADLGMKQITGVLSNDIRSRNYPPGYEVIKVYHSREYDLPCHTRLQTLLSTDKGVAFLLTCPEGIFYHGGDLNDWNMPDTPEPERRQMTGSYRASIRKLAGIPIDAACVPLDPGLGDNYAAGLLFFLKNVIVKKVFPMHYLDCPEIVDRFLREYPEYAPLVIRPEP